MLVTAIITRTVHRQRFTTNIVPIEIMMYCTVRKSTRCTGNGNRTCYAVDYAVDDPSTPPCPLDRDIATDILPALRGRYTDIFARPKTLL